ncbi:hypothetical protein WAI453_009262 [Rhynchosporium graminicola]
MAIASPIRVLRLFKAKACIQSPNPLSNTYIMSSSSGKSSSSSDKTSSSNAKSSGSSATSHEPASNASTGGSNQSQTADDSGRYGRIFESAIDDVKKQAHKDNNG